MNTKLSTKGIRLNDAERSIRTFCVGKHNWHISATKAGVRASGMLYSITETAKANGLKPYEYLTNTSHMQK